MGGRRGASRQVILGSGGKHGISIAKKLKEGSPQAVAEAAFEAIATATGNPAVETIYTAYQVASYVYPIVKQGMSEYSRSHNADKALDRMKQETIRQTGRAVKDKTFEAVADVAVRGAMNSAGIRTDKVVTTFIKTAVAETLREVVP